MTDQPSEIEQQAMAAAQENVDTAEDHDHEDVPAALERQTDDGPGFENESELPAETFESYAEDDVEVDES